MRATRLPIPVLPTATCRRGLAALIAVALLSAAPGAISASNLQIIQWGPEYSGLLLGQDPAAKKQAPEPAVGRRRTKKPTGPAAQPEKKIVIDPALERDKTELPGGYKVPPEKLPDIKINKPLPFVSKPKEVDKSITNAAEKEKEKQRAKAEADAWRKHNQTMSQYRNLLQKGTLGDSKADRELLRYGIKYKLAQMTQHSILFPSDEDRERIKKAQEEGAKNPQPPETIEHLRESLLQDLDKTGNAVNGAMDVRDAFIDVLCEECTKLLDNNFYVRFNVAEILSSINNREANPQKGTPEVPGFRALKALLDLVNDAKQHPLYKLHPVQALAKICRHKDCKPEDRFAIIECLMNQMVASKSQQEWYAKRVAESLGQLGEPYDRTRQPVVVEALMNVLKDTGYTFLVRVEAGHSLGRVSLEGFRRSDEIAVELLRLAAQMAEEFQKDKANPRWRLYFAMVYFSFQPADATERAEKRGLLGQVDSKPALAGTKTVVTEAYQLFLPLAQNALGGTAEATINDQLRKIKPWLDAHSKGPGNGNPVAVNPAP